MNGRGGSSGPTSTSRTEFDASTDVQAQEQESCEENLKAGIFNSDVDSLIANRLAEKLRDVGCEANRYDFLPAGESKMGLLEEFIKTHDALIWIASAASIKDDGMMKATRDIAQHSAIAHAAKQFFIFQPREYLSVKLPHILDAYSPLREDEYFNERLRATLNRIKKKRDHAKKLHQGNSSSSPANTVVDEREQLRTVPVSDIVQTAALQNSVEYSGQARVVQYSEQVQSSLCAQPDGSDCTTKSTRSSKQESLALKGRAADTPTIHNTFIIKKSNVTIHAGSALSGPPVQEAESGRGDKENNE